MIKGGNRLRFSLESLSDFRISFHVFVQNFHGNATAKLLVDGDVDVSHPTFADEIDDAVTVTEKFVTH